MHLKLDAFMIKSYYTIIMNNIKKNQTLKCFLMPFVVSIVSFIYIFFFFRVRNVFKYLIIYIFIDLAYESPPSPEIKKKRRGRCQKDRQPAGKNERNKEASSRNR